MALAHAGAPGLSVRPLLRGGDAGVRLAQAEAEPQLDIRRALLHPSSSSSGLCPLAVGAFVAAGTVRAFSRRGSLQRSKRAGRLARGRVTARRAVPMEDHEYVEQCLRASDTLLIMNDLPDDTMGRLMDGMERYELPAGEVLFNQGDSSDAMFLLQSGELAERRRLMESDEQELEVAKMSEGMLVDDMALLVDQPRSSTVTALQDTVLWRLNRQHFMHVLEDFAKEAQVSEEQKDDEECEIDFDNMRSIFVVSDGTGDTCANSLGLALKQFDLCYQGASNYALSTFQYVKKQEEILEITRRAREEGALIVYTLMGPDARTAMREEVTRTPEPGEGSLRAVDLWEPLMVQLEGLLGSKRILPVSPVARRPVCESCLTMIDAIEFTKKLDDGVLPHLWHEADVILIGLSRAGKTPLSFYLAQRGYKVANYPAVPDEDPPEELFAPELQEKCVALSISPQRLQAVRSERMKEFGRASSEYASAANCTKEVAWLRTFYMRRGPGWPVVDTTNGGVEECAAKIIKMLEDRRIANGGDASKRVLSPSVV
mmetsp:Transcript_16153/g.41808  ORF Transcript_16153/g.41808 Transcript_16153/m.41808 type:complete len:543 (-) Transcript_16153:72-1700(-)